VTAVMLGGGGFWFEGSDIGCLLLHGFTGCPQNVRPLGEFLARRGMTVLCRRLAGHGTSVDDFEHTGADNWIASADGALDELLRTCSSVFAIGISMGGTLALHLGAARGKDLHGIAAINAPVMRMPNREALGSDTRPGARVPVPWTDPRLFTKRPDVHLLAYRELPTHCLREASNLYALVENELARVEVPTLLLYSDDDLVVSPANGPYVLERLATSHKRLVRLTESAHEATLDFDVERIGLEFLQFVRQAGVLAAQTIR
jgi:carboxylesterase